jgi:hypothetical protein
MRPNETAPAITVVVYGLFYIPVFLSGAQAFRIIR